MVLLEIWGACDSSHLACSLVLGRGSERQKHKDSVDSLPQNQLYFRVK